MDLQKKYGPLPIWGWVGVTVIPVGGFLIYRRRKAAQAAAIASANAPGANTSGPVVGSTPYDTAANTQYPGSQSYYINAPTVNGSASDTNSQALQAKLQSDIAYLVKAERDWGANNAWVQYGSPAQKAAGAKALPADVAARDKTNATILSDIAALAASNMSQAA